MQKIRIGGVPEHFMLPIHLAKENGQFEERGFEIEWTDFGGGTGQMTKALENDEVDVCILLTEGIINAIIRGNQSKIISNYVITPLTWGIHTGATNSLSNYDDIFDKKYAISRHGSGSHLMAMVDAHAHEKYIEKEQFQVIKNLDGAIKSLEENESDVFYWEKFTTKPYVDSGQLKRVGEYQTPWPCFVVAATDKIINEQADNITRMLRVIHDSCDKFMHAQNSIKQVSERYKLLEADAQRWFHSTEWAIHGWVSEKMIENVIFYLKAADIVDAEAAIPEFIWKRNA